MAHGDTKTGRDELRKLSLALDGPRHRGLRIREPVPCVTPRARRPSLASVVLRETAERRRIVMRRQPASRGTRFAFVQIMDRHPSVCERARALLSFACLLSSVAAMPACQQSAEDSQLDSADAATGQSAVDAATGIVIEAGGGADPNCHYDCFGGAECKNGVVTRYVHTPVPCAFWTGKCPTGEAFQCERGCRIDMAQTHDPAIRASEMCEELRPKKVGDPCTDESYCEPQVATWDSDWKVTNTYLQCDTDAGTCIEREPPQVADWLAPCGLVPDGQPGYAYGVVPTDACSGGLCAFVESEACVLQGCTTACDSDDDCPPGAVCQNESPSYCKPGPPNVTGVDLACPP